MQLSRRTLLSFLPSSLIARAPPAAAPATEQIISVETSWGKYKEIWTNHFDPADLVALPHDVRIVHLFGGAVRQVALSFSQRVCKCCRVPESTQFITLTRDDRDFPSHGYALGWNWQYDSRPCPIVVLKQDKPPWE